MSQKAVDSINRFFCVQYFDYVTFSFSFIS